ncbi:MAG: AEC family transporter [Bacillota bacterium]|nr:AEC family transporter [Bacillota bacterium]
MENFIVSLNVVLPLLCLMILGFGLRKLGLFDDVFLKKCNKLLFKVFLPTLVFYSLYHSDIREVFDLRLLLYGAVGITIYFLITSFFCSRFIKDESVSATTIQGAYRSNCLIFGIPIATSLYGAGGVGPTALIACVMVPLYNIFSVLVFSDKRAGFKQQLMDVITNPLIIGVILGLFFVGFDIKLPEGIESAVGSVAGIGSPFSLIVLGASFHFSIPKAKLAPLTGTISLKLILEPLVFLTIGYLLFGFTGSFFVGLMAAFGTPSSSTSYIVATEMGGDSELAAQIVVYSSLVSIITIFFTVFAGINLGIL